MFASAKTQGLSPRRERVWAEGGHAGKWLAWVFACCRWVLEIVQRNEDVTGSSGRPSGGWWHERSRGSSNDRRLSQHDESGNETGEAMIPRAMIHLMLRRLTTEKPKTEIT